jgi:N-acetyl-gamma-glutamyl-phosphate/LysW-gamma-L-alpha-aminoadipyl-6-phosphate reductase
MSSQRFRAAVVGGSGYGAAELIRRLLAHPHVELARVASIDFVGEPLWAVHPTLEGHTDLRFEALAPAVAAQGMDVVFLGLPHFVSAEAVPSILAAGARIVDMSGDFRLRDLATYEKYYGGKHPCPDVFTSGRFVYGLPELNRAALRETRCVASPGCFATAIELALLPLAKAGWLRGGIEIVGVTGSSGSGATPSATTHHAVRANNLRTYKPLTHQHVPEIVQTLTDAGGKAIDLRFVPVSAPLVRGIFATCFAHVDASVPAPAIEARWGEMYAGERFVRVPKKRLPEVAVVKGTNYAEVGVTAGDAEAGTRTVACFAALDNVIKGGAGQAIQSMNLMLGLPEHLTLEDPGAWP